ncbi:MAG: hypothetical protein WA637_02650 [Terriglobales bacterium]
MKCQSIERIIQACHLLALDEEQDCAEWIQACLAMGTDCDEMTGHAETIPSEKRAQEDYFL